MRKVIKPQRLDKASKIIQSAKYVRAAEVEPEEETDGILDAVDDVADSVEEIQDNIEDVHEDYVDIAVNNNITDHYIAECERCQNVFISAVIRTEEDVESVHGVCPLCHEETDQYLKWYIKDVNS